MVLAVPWVVKRTTLGFVGGVVVSAVNFAVSPQLRFLAGGAMVNAAITLQEGVVEPDEETPQQVWSHFLGRNALASRVRETLPRPAPHPTVAMLVCMDSRIDTAELAGDLRHGYYVVRTAGSVMNPKEEDMLELAAERGVKLIAITRHSDCAAEAVAKDPALRVKYPALATAVDERDQRLQEFLARPAIASRLRAGRLLVKTLDIDTSTEHAIEHLSTTLPAPAADPH